MNVTYSIFDTPSTFRLGSFDILEPEIIKLWKSDRLSNLRLDELHLKHLNEFCTKHNLKFSYHRTPKELIFKV